jgi:hypothetical protein
LIQNKWIGGARSIKNISAGPTQAGERRARSLAHHVTSETPRARAQQNFDQIAETNVRHRDET